MAYTVHLLEGPRVMFAEHTKPAITIRQVVKCSWKFAKCLSLLARLRNYNSALEILFEKSDHRKRPASHRYIGSTQCTKVRSRCSFSFFRRAASFLTQRAILKR